MKENYKEFSIIRKDAGWGLRYILQVKSGSRNLNFILDSGAPESLILKDSLEGCDYYDKTRAKFPYCIFNRHPCKGNKLKVKLVLSTRSNNEIITIDNLCFIAIPTDNIEDTEFFQRENVDGILGTDFLKDCSVSFIDKILFRNT